MLGRMHLGYPKVPRQNERDFMIFMDSGKYYDVFYEILGEHPLKPWDFHRFDRTFRHILRDGKLHDVGCGVGHWLDFLSKKTKLRLSGSDVSSNAVERANRNLEGRRIKVRLGDIRNLQYKNKEFDQITALEVIEHVPDWERAVKEMIRITRKRVIITVPYEERLSYGRCPYCRENVFIDGHLNKFKEKDFLRFKKYGRISFERIYHPFKLKDFLRRGIGIFFGKGDKENKEKKSLGIVCQNCYGKIKYKKYFLRVKNRIYKLLTRKPEYLLVRIDL